MLHTRSDQSVHTWRRQWEWTASVLCIYTQWVYYAISQWPMVTEHFNGQTPLDSHSWQLSDYRHAVWKWSQVTLVLKRRTNFTILTHRTAHELWATKTNKPREMASGMCVLSNYRLSALLCCDGNKETDWFVEVEIWVKCITYKTPHSNVQKLHR